MTSINKRFIKEIKQLYLQQNQKELIQNDYLIYYDETDISKLSAIIKAPYDSVYRHKFIRLNFKIPDNYPHSPPEVTFVNHDGVRIHPNMYENGKCCATILNTWGDNKFEKWTSSMSIETILLTFHSFLDNNPYMYEPGGRDDQNYTTYVQYQSWYTCLIRYLQHEQIDVFRNYIYSYMLNNIDVIFQDLHALQELYPSNYYQTRCFEIDSYFINYTKVCTNLQNFYNYIDFSENQTNNFDEILSYEDFINREYECCICYDTNIETTYLTLNCKHTFHKICLQNHTNANNNICPMCRTELDNQDTINLTDEAPHLDHPCVNDTEWIINPLTKRRVKVGSKTWKYLYENNIIT